MAAVIASSGVLLAAVYLVWMFQRTMHSEDSGAGAGKGDLTWREIATLAPLIVLIVGIGVFPGRLLSAMESSVGALVTQVAAVRAGRRPRISLASIFR